MEFFEVVKERFSCRKFSSKPVEDEKLEKILEAGRLAPTAKNAQPVKVWAVKSPEALAKVRAVAPFPWIKDASVVLVVGGTSEGAFLRPSDNRSFGDVDATIVATHLMLAIEDAGLGTTWVGFFDVPKLKELFPDMKDYDIVAMFPIGYKADDAAPSERHPLRKAKDELVKYL